ncbi:MAG: hypothetical protein K0S74_1108 [Chlamydiales bacterium]|jgi:hypothetical protein|nr:hypothetical protein [Chlamydiales bacterium]
MSFDPNLNLNRLPNLNPLEKNTGVEKTEKTLIEQTKGECREYVEKNIDKTVQKAEPYALSQTKLSALIPGTKSLTRQNSGNLKDEMPLTKNISEPALPYALGNGAKAIARALKEKTSPNLRKKKEEQPERQKKESSKQENEEEITVKELMEKEGLSSNEISRIELQSEQLYGSASDLLGQVKEKQQKTETLLWRKV